MVITYLGGGAFRVQSGEVSLLLDPGTNRLKADVVLRSRVPASITPEEASSDEIMFPGEYEAKGIEIKGVLLEAAKDAVKVAYAVRWEDVLIAIVAQASETPSAEAADELGSADVLLIANGAERKDELFEKIVKRIEPKVAVVGLDKGSEMKFLGEKRPAEERFTFKKKDIPADGLKVVVLKP